jgi:hypothetical protein
LAQSGRDPADCDRHGHLVLDVLVQSRRDKEVAKRLFRKLLKKQGRAPRVLESAILRNGSALDNLPPQVLEAQQHGEHTLKLAVEVHLITPEPFQFVRVERVAECLGTNQRAILELFPPILVPRNHLLFQEPQEVGRIGCLINRSTGHILVHWSCRQALDQGMDQLLLQPVHRLAIELVVLNCCVTETNDTSCASKVSNEPGKIGERSGEPVYLVDNDNVDPAGPNIGERALERGPLQIAAGEPAIVIEGSRQHPALVLLLNGV